ncbi:MAG: 3-keto-5-aminohexanoate cleavage protein [Henriciella sp.]
MPNRLRPLPRIMVAPNGARRQKRHHPNIPIEAREIVADAKACFEAGADGIHLHIREKDGRHLLDAGRYQDLLDRLTQVVPEMYLQVTSEAAGRYTAQKQCEMIMELVPDFVSVGFREINPPRQELNEAKRFYQSAYNSTIRIQHILYSKEDVINFAKAIGSGIIPDDQIHVLHVIGAYKGEATSNPAEIAPRVKLLEQLAPGKHIDWMVCAFGSTETACLLEAINLGGKVRIGFENSIWHPNGDVAESNADRIRNFISLV